MPLWFEEVRSISKIECGSNLPKNDRVIHMEKDSIYSKNHRVTSIEKVHFDPKSIKHHKVTPMQKGPFWPKIDKKS